MRLLSFIFERPWQLEVSECSRWLETGKHDTGLQKMGDLRNRRLDAACQNWRAKPPGSCVQAHEGQGDREQPAWMNKGKNHLANLLAFCVEKTGSTDHGRGADGVYLDFTKACNMILHSSLAVKLRKAWAGVTTRKIKSCLEGHAQRGAVNGLKSNQQPGTTKGWLFLPRDWPHYHQQA